MPPANTSRRQSTAWRTGRRRPASAGAARRLSRRASPPRGFARPFGGSVFFEQLGKLLGHGAAELLGVDDGDGAPVIARHIVADACLLYPSDPADEEDS